MTWHLDLGERRPPSEFAGLVYVTYSTTAVDRAWAIKESCAVAHGFRFQQRFSGG
jgi:hypothetical protein